MKTESKKVQISAPKLEQVRLRIDGTAPYMQCAFSAKTENQMRAKQEAGSTEKGKKLREAKDFDRCGEEATHYAQDGWPGIPAASFRAAMISACRLVGFKMTLAKLSFWVVADGHDRHSGDPLVQIHGDKHLDVRHTRNATGVPDMRARPMWDSWHAFVTVEFDADQFTLEDIINLLTRVGLQVGIGEGRPDSRASAGLGFGTFAVSADATASAAE